MTELEHALMLIKELKQEIEDSRLQMKVDLLEKAVLNLSDQVANRRDTNSNLPPSPDDFD